MTSAGAAGHTGMTEPPPWVSSSKRQTAKSARMTLMRTRVPARVLSVSRCGWWRSPPTPGRHGGARQPSRRQSRRAGGPPRTRGRQSRRGGEPQPGQGRALADAIVDARDGHERSEPRPSFLAKCRCGERRGGVGLSLSAITVQAARRLGRRRHAGSRDRGWTGLSPGTRRRTEPQLVPGAVGCAAPELCMGPRDEPISRGRASRW